MALVQSKWSWISIERRYQPLIYQAFRLSWTGFYLQAWQDVRPPQPYRDSFGSCQKIFLFIDLKKQIKRKAEQFSATFWLSPPSSPGGTSHLQESHLVAEAKGNMWPDPHPPHPDQSRLSKGHSESISGQPWCSMNSPAPIFCQHVFCKSCCHNNRISMNDFKQEKVDSAGNIYYQVPFFVFQNLT